MNDPQTTPRECSPRAYLAALLVPVLVFLTVVGVFNGIVDPYVVIDGPRIAGFNAEKPVAYYNDRLFKLHEATRRRPNAVALGSSRVGMGIDPFHPFFAGTDSYNLGLTGADMYETWRTWQHVAALREPQLVVVGLDFFMFNALGRDHPGFREDRLRVNRHGSHQLVSHYVDLPPVLWSTEAIEASLTTIDFNRRTHGSGERAARYERGRFDEQPWLEPIARRGHGIEFFQRQNDFIWQGFDFAYRDGRGGNRQLTAFSHLLADLQARGIAAHLFITPVHAHHLEVLRVSGRWDDFEAWKRDLVAANQAAATAAGTQPLPLWDFTGYAGANAEPVPSIGDADTRMRWYWEASHFKVDLGNQVLERLAGDEPRQLAGFGRHLDANTVDAVLAEIVDQRASWLERFADQAADIHTQYVILDQLYRGEIREEDFTPEQLEAIRQRIKEVTEGTRGDEAPPTPPASSAGAVP